MSTEELSRREARGPRSTYFRTYWPDRLRLLRRLALVGMAGLLLAIFAVGVSRVIRMIGLPDVGDPFARPAGPRMLTRGGEDPIALFNQALECLNRHRDRTGQPARVGRAPGNPIVFDPYTLELNRDTLDLFRRGAECRAAPPEFGRAEGLSFQAKSQAFGELTILAVAEAARLESEGDVEGAWTWLRAALRSTYHYEVSADVYSRLMAQNLRREIAEEITTWSEDSDIKAPLLRRAIDDVIACDALLPSDLVTLETGYRSLMRELDVGQWGGPRSPDDFLVGKSGWRLPNPLGQVWWQGRRFLDNEPERSERVVRLTFANWRAWVEQHPRHRPKPAIRTMVSRGPGNAFNIDLFAAGPDSSPAARRMSPRRLADWCETIDDAAIPLSMFWSTFNPIRRQELMGRAGLILGLAEQAYIRDHGEPPPTQEALVGPYLKSLPDDGSSELDDGTVPTTRPR